MRYQSRWIGYQRGRDWEVEEEKSWRGKNREFISATQANSKHLNDVFFLVVVVLYCHSKWVLWATYYTVWDMEPPIGKFWQCLHFWPATEIRLLSYEVHPWNCSNRVYVHVKVLCFTSQACHVIVSLSHMWRYTLCLYSILFNSPLNYILHQEYLNSVLSSNHK